MRVSASRLTAYAGCGNAFSARRRPPTAPRPRQVGQHGNDAQHQQHGGDAKRQGGNADALRPGQEIEKDESRQPNHAADAGQPALVENLALTAVAGGHVNDETEDQAEHAAEEIFPAPAVERIVLCRGVVDVVLPAEQPAPRSDEERSQSDQHSQQGKDTDGSRDLQEKVRGFVTATPAFGP